MTALLALLLVGCSRAEPPTSAAAPSASVAASGRIVAVGDLHGDLDNALSVLRLAGVVDDAGRWSGGDTVLVQTGDTTDRGPDSKALLALLRRLQTEAEAAGGRVVALLGNHEAMNLTGDWRYVDPGDVERYGGVEARKAALGPDGEDGRWLRSLDAVARIDDTVFVHGGVSTAYAGLGIDAINRKVREALIAGDPRATVLGPDGPLWYRGYVQDPESVACPTLAKALVALDAERMVVGHTTRRDGRVEARCDGALLVIDIGIADHYGAHLGALQIDSDDDGSALYPTGPLDLPDP